MVENTGRISPFKENIPHGISGGSINQDTSETHHILRDYLEFRKFVKIHAQLLFQFVESFTIFGVVTYCFFLVKASVSFTH